MWIFVLGLGVLNVIFERDREAVGGLMGNGVGWLRGEELWKGRDKRQTSDRKEN